MKIAFILDPLESIKTYKDTSFAMMREACARSHRIFSIQQ
ncbi:MAG: glutathione synthase, partial [Burkholderiales bacterium]